MIMWTMQSSQCGECVSQMSWLTEVDAVAKNAIYILLLANTDVYNACQGTGWDGATTRKLTEGRGRRGRAWESQKTSQKNVRGARGSTLPIERMASMFMQIYASSEECALL